MSLTKLNSAIAAIKSGDKDTGSRLLKELLKAEPSNETAWIWLSTTVDDISIKKHYLQKALSINPNNKIVIKALVQLDKPPQPTIEEIVHSNLAKTESLIEKTLSFEVKPAISTSSAKLVPLSVKVPSPVKIIPKPPAKKKINNFIILAGVLIIIICGIGTVGILLGSYTIMNSESLDKLTAFDENDALHIVQGWKIPKNQGMTCEEVFNSVVYVYKYNLGISDANVKWSVTKENNSLFIVHADLKGETGWANYSWQVRFPKQTITPIGELNLCKP